MKPTLPQPARKSVSRMPGNPSTIHPPPEQPGQDQHKAEDDKNKDKDADSQ